VACQFLRTSQHQLKNLVMDLAETPKAVNPNRRVLVVHNLVECTEERVLIDRIQESKLIYCDDLETEEKFPGHPAWEVMTYKSNEGTHQGIFQYFETPLFVHVFLVNDPPGPIATLKPDQLWRRQHNERAFEFLRERLRTATVPVSDSFCLPKEMALGLWRHLSTFTEDFDQETMEITLQHRPGDKVPVLLPSFRREKTGNISSYDLPTKHFKLSDVQFIDERPLISDSFKGRVSTTDPKRFRFKIEMPGVLDKDQITLKRVRKRVPRHYVQVTARRPILGGEDIIQSTFIVYFDPHGDTFSMEKSTALVMESATLEAGVFTLFLDKEREDE